MKPAEWVNILRYFSLITGIGLTFSVSVWLGWLLGMSVEHRVGGIGWLISGVLLGVAAGFTAVYSMLKKFLPWE